jgi:hypothetical protein
VQFELGKRGHVSAEGEFGFSTAIDVVEDPARQQPLGDRPQVVDVGATCEAAKDPVGLEAPELKERPDGIEWHAGIPLAGSVEYI